MQLGTRCAFQNKKLIKIHKNYHKNEITAIKSSNNGQLVGTVCGDAGIQIYDTFKMEMKSQFNTQQGYQYTSLDIC